MEFALLGGQFVIADVFHTQLTDFNGNPIKNTLVTGTGTATLNTIQVNATCTTTACRSLATNPITYLQVAAAYAWDLFMLIMGLGVFQFLFQLGVPLIFLSGFIAMYLFLLIRSLMGWLRGISGNSILAIFQKHLLDDRISYNERYLICIGNSMKNYFGLGIVKIKKYNEYKVGDRISFVANNKGRYCHRIISIDENKFTTKGDNFNDSKDYEIDVSVKNIEGKVIWSCP